jgi:hypothetical protein
VGPEEVRAAQEGNSDGDAAVRADG